MADGQTGLLAAPDDPEALAVGLARGLAEAEALGAAGLRRAQERFSVARMAEATLDVYETALGGSDVAALTHHPPPTR